MKKRCGFVSNSSSSSFIVNDNHTVFEYAMDMLNAQKLYWKDLNEEKDVRIELSIIDALNRALINGRITENTPVAFRSCNYNTYLCSCAGAVVVNTCNNVPWDTYSSIIPESTMVITTDNENYDISNLINFYWPEFDDFGKMCFQTCPNCGKYCDVFVPQQDDLKYLCSCRDKEFLKEESSNVDMYDRYYTVEITFKEPHCNNIDFVRGFAEGIELRSSVLKARVVEHE